jgi:transcriptional regulator with XRE-family HTH domain|uniref:Repressor protein n=1 Tax=Myoviridae sp. ctvxP16 TaxID=2825205 RepID=A0A8S5UTV7_9CAUD|nr:MAG TPA: repressor protein [Myoviridae sp. ctvxP16]
MIDMDRLKFLRENYGISARKLADRVGFSQTKISKIERGEQKMSIPQALAFADFFNVSVDYLLGASAEESFSRFVKSYGLDRVCDADLLAKFRAVVSSVNSDER